MTEGREEEFLQEALIKRLKRIEGQVRGIQKMILTGRDCESVLTQLAAVRSAIEGTGTLVLNNYMRLCFHQDDEQGSSSVDSLARAVCIWGGVRIGEEGGGK